MEQAEESFYSILKIGRNATPDQVRKAYFNAARLLHPDTNPDPDASEQFILLQQAYEVLSDSVKRAAYDQTLEKDEPVDTGVSVNNIFSRPSLVSIDDPQLIYVLMEVLATSKPGETLTVPLNICLVIDRSTSMGGPRMDMVKASALNLVRQMKPDSYISVVSFSDYAELVVPATRLNDIRKIESGIQLLHASGATEIYQGLEAGINEVRRYLNPRYINHLILLTDGRTYGDEADCLRLAELASQQGIGISCLGIGSEWNDEFIDKLVSYSGGNSLFVSNPSDVDHFLSEKFKNLTNIYAEGVTLEFDCDSEVELRYAFRLKPDQMPLPISRSICLGNILSSSSLSVVFEFLVKSLPKRRTEVSLVFGKLKMNIPSRMNSMSAMNIQLNRTISEKVTPNSPNTAILQALAQLSLYRMQEKARIAAAGGDIKQATSHLKNLATHLLSMGERKLAHTVLIEAESLMQKKEYSQEGDKKIKYGTRALFLLPEGAASKT
jgi:Ca-activated chloride channel family protein